ncbi:hypothetical protein DPM19_12105 [Actinomadura craniellae]|uniref:Uncharacterized protein n=1 Tax=Actinomadura craniellae TaxID=2231787 RepID=A0A365H8L6_9ACTN|nr:hypothetical protein DPM19_12105 [Actinomadura craniellae]
MNVSRPDKIDLASMVKIDPSYVALLDWLSVISASAPALPAALAATLHDLLRPHAPYKALKEPSCRHDGEPWPCTSAARAVAALVEHYESLLADLAEKGPDASPPAPDLPTGDEQLLHGLAERWPAWRFWQPRIFDGDTVPWYATRGGINRLPTRAEHRRGLRSGVHADTADALEELIKGQVAVERVLIDEGVMEQPLLMRQTPPSPPDPDVPPDDHANDPAPTSSPTSS